jgi:hypothetical protein
VTIPSNEKTVVADDHMQPRFWKMVATTISTEFLRRNRNGDHFHQMKNRGCIWLYATTVLENGGNYYFNRISQKK